MFSGQLKTQKKHLLNVKTEATLGVEGDGSDNACEAVGDVTGTANVKVAGRDRVVDGTGTAFLTGDVPVSPGHMALEFHTPIALAHMPCTEGVTDLKYLQRVSVSLVRYVCVRLCIHRRRDRRRP